jgi:hypothetical protein
MKTVVAAIIQNGGFAWQLFNGGSGFWADVTHPPGYNASAAASIEWSLGARGDACSSSLRAACQAGSYHQREAFHYNFDDMSNTTALEQQLAGFLLMRGNYSWFGYGFQGGQRCLVLLYPPPAPPSNTHTHPPRSRQLPHPHRTAASMPPTKCHDTPPVR